MRMRAIAILCLAAGCGDARVGPVAASVDLAARGSGVVRLTAVAGSVSGNRITVSCIGVAPVAAAPVRFSVDGAHVTAHVERLAPGSLRVNPRATAAAFAAAANADAEVSALVRAQVVEPGLAPCGGRRSRLGGGRAAPPLLRYEFHRVDHVSPGVG